MTIEKNLLKQFIKFVLKEARIYGDPYRTSDEYELSPEEISAIKNMDHKQRMRFASKKLIDARRSKGQCISGGPKCELPSKGPDGKPGPYCEKHLASFRASRERLTKKRGSCSRCPNPPLPGKKLCKKCADELELQRITALANGLCIRCKKNPMEPNEKGEPTLFCRSCMKAKVDWNKQRNKFKQGWKDYAKDVETAALANKLKSQGIDPK